MSTIVQVTPQTSRDTVIRTLAESTTDVHLEIQLTLDEVRTITGMVALPSGVVTPGDIGRVLEAAVPSGQFDDAEFVNLGTTVFALVDALLVPFPPVGMTGQRLEATVHWCCLPRGWLRGMRELIDVHGHRLVSVSMKIVNAT